jgi:predicted cobalt transporter CbtA
MIKTTYFASPLILAALMTASVAAVAANPKHAPTKATTAASNKAPAEAPKPADTPIAYKELESRIGAELAIETTFNTVRRGTLVRYTNPGLTLRLGPEAGAIELEVPAETIRRVSIVTPAPQTATPPQENSSAKKN